MNGMSVNICYAASELLTSEKGEKIFPDFAGKHQRALISLSYWKTDEGDVFHPSGVDGRTEEDMKYPFGTSTYFLWDFKEVWQVDPDGEVNDGFPFFRYWDVEVREAEIYARPPYPSSEEDFAAYLESWEEEEDFRYDRESNRISDIAGLISRNSHFILLLLGMVGMVIVYYLVFKLQFYIGLVLLGVNASGLVYKTVQLDFTAVITLIISLYIGLMFCLSRYKTKFPNKDKADEEID